MVPPSEPFTAGILLLSVGVQLAAALVAMGQMRLVGGYRYAWVAISLALVLMVQRRISPLLDLMDGHTRLDSSALVGLLISTLMLVGVLGLRALFADMRRQERELVRLATTDALTQIHNRRHALALARQELVRQHRTGRPLALLIMDLDHFKAVNDTYGHAAGDALLTKVGAACKESLRAMDVLGRLGGEEFVMILPETDEAQAITSAERLRARVAGLETLAAGVTVRITTSIGIAIATTRSRNPDASLAELLRQADAALYAAKAAGRDRCMVWRPDLAAQGDPEPASP